MRDHPLAGRDPATVPAKKKTAPAKGRTAAAGPSRSMQVIVTGVDVATGKKVSVLLTGRDPATGKTTD